MIKIQIKTWYGSLLFEYEKENNTVKETLLAAITAKANLGGANLRDANLGDANLGDADLGDANLGGANLRGANLRGANLGGANLGGANLRGANLGGANLRDANLGDANLGDADLGDANLGGADLRGANLGGANLRGANLGGANLGDANLGDADLGGFKHDIWAILLHAPHEIQGLVDSINAGKINGSVYEGECACLLGTIANVKGVRHTEIPGLVPDSRRPAEIWFLQFKKGQTPENYSPLKLTLDWIEEFRKLLSLAK